MNQAFYTTTRLGGTNIAHVLRSSNLPLETISVGYNLLGHFTYSVITVWRVFQKKVLKITYWRFLAAAIEVLPKTSNFKRHVVFALFGRLFDTRLLERLS